MTRESESSRINITLFDEILFINLFFSQFFFYFIYLYLIYSHISNTSHINHYNMSDSHNNLSSRMQLMKHIASQNNRFERSSIKSSDLQARDLNTFSDRSTFIKIKEKRQAILRNAQTIELIKIKTNDQNAKRNLMKKLRDDSKFLKLNTKQQAVREEVKMKRLKQKRFDEQKFDKYNYHNHLSR